jgi:Icc-related predicted phosphoesterase
MKLKLASDIHLENYAAGQPLPDLGRGDILVLAGDILCARHFKTDGYLHSVYDTFLNDCSKNYEKVLYVKGNHEFYGYNYEGTHKKILDNLPDNFHLLENETIKIGNVNFIGFTFWTDFRKENPLEMMDAQSYMNDYKVIRITSNYRKLNTNDTLQFHKDSKQYLLNKLDELKDEEVFVISHHSPTLQSIAPEFKNSCNGAYCSDLDDLILDHPNIKHWVYGHSHTAMDFYIGGCRVINNAVGYPGQDTKYNPHLFVTI